MGGPCEMEDSKRGRGWKAGLAAIRIARRGRPATQAESGKQRGRPKGRRMAHEALHAALAGFGRDAPA